VRRLLPWLAALLPALACALTAAWLAQNASINQWAYIRAPLSTWAIITGLVLSLAALAAVAALAWGEFRRRQALDDAQLEAVRDRRRFLQRLDHELKNPLTAIRAGLALIPSNGEPAALTSVEAQVRRMSRLTADLRKLAELESRPLERGSVDLNAVLNQVFELAQERPEAADRRLTLTLPQAPWPLPTVPGDFDLLVLVAHNLLDNAIKFSRPGDTLEVRAFEDGASVVVEVADTGPGIPEDELPHVWEELYRGSGGRGVPGSGLGLALARAIILRHGGQVALRSRAGQGTVVTVRLPLKT
jgi:two-component system, OmpR family, sensor kinase